MLRLSRFVYAAEVSGHLIFLNSKNNTYECLLPEDAGPVLQILKANSAFSSELAENSSDDNKNVSIIQEMKASGLLTERMSGRQFIQQTHLSVLQELPRLIGRDRPDLRSRHIIQFTRALIAAKLMLSLLPLNKCIDLIRERKVREAANRDRNDVEKITDLFLRARPIFFSKKDNCLLNSLSLVNFLSYYGVGSTLFFGVKLEPFQAHAWVEHDGILLADMPANVHRYAVILEV